MCIQVAKYLRNTTRGNSLPPVDEECFVGILRIPVNFFGSSVRGHLSHFGNGDLPKTFLRNRPSRDHFALGNTMQGLKIH